MINMTNVDADKVITDLAIFKPSEVVEISVGELSAPIQTGVELSKLAVLEKSILFDLLSNTDRVDGKLILHPEALAWARELRMLYKDIHELTKGVQDKIMLKKMDIVGSLYTRVIKGKTTKEIIDTIRELQDGSGG